MKLRALVGWFTTSPQNHLLQLSGSSREKLKIMICVAGKNEIGVYGLQLLLKNFPNEDIRVICNSTDKGFDTWQPSLLKAANDRGVKVISLEDCYDIGNLVFLSLEFNKIVDPVKFKDASLYNIHFSNLPAYKGMYTSAMPLLNGESESGVTLHEIDSGIDTGNIIDKIIFDIETDDTARDLYRKYLDYSKVLLEKNLSNIVYGKTISKPQPSIGSSYYSLKSIDYKNLEVNLNATAQEVKNQIRAYTFPEYQLPKVHGFYVNSADILSKRSSSKSGELISTSEQKINISTNDYDLSLFRDKTYELFEAASSNNAALAEECLEYGANINARRENGWTPTIVSCYNGSLEVLLLLIKKGADINLPNYKGTTPLMYAMSFYELSKEKTLFDTLVKYGADTEMVDIFSKTIKIDLD